MSGPSLNSEVFNAAAYGGTFDEESVGAVMYAMTPQLADFLRRMGDEPRTDIWMRAEFNMPRDRLRRLAAVGYIRSARGWTWTRRWVRTERGARFYRIWAEEMARRTRTAARGMSWQPGEEPQPGDTVITSTGIKQNIPMFGGDVLPDVPLPPGMTSGVRIVPHDPVARDVPWIPPDDMVAALGLLDETEAASIDYLVGANSAAAATAARMEQILPMLQGMGFADRRGRGWVRTMRGTRMHVTWLAEAEQRVKQGTQP